MLKVAGAVYIMTAPVIMGTLVVVLLSMDLFEAVHIAAAAIGGALIAVPVTWFIAKRILALTRET